MICLPLLRVERGRMIWYYVMPPKLEPVGITESKNSSGVELDPAHCHSFITLEHLHIR